MSRALDEYAQRMRAASQSNDLGYQRTIAITSDHLTTILEIMISMRNALQKCSSDHTDNQHQKRTLEIIDDIIRERLLAGPPRQ